MFNRLITLSVSFITTILIFSSSTLGVGTNPTINFDGDLTKKAPSGDAFNYYIISRDVYRRSLGQSTQQILATFKYNLPSFVSQTLPIVETENYNGYDLYSIKYDMFSRHKAVYIIQSGQSIGYNINSSFDISDFLDDSRITGIKALTLNPDYLSLALNTTPNIDNVKVYETVVGTFTERYIIASRTAQEFIIMYSFYPTELETKLKPDIVDAVNYNLNALDKRYNISEY